MTKVMLVTGASRGIGAEIARLAARQGWRVGVNYNHSADAAHRVVSEIGEAGGRAVALHADVGRCEEVARMFAELDQAFGPVDALINNAGVMANFRIADAEAEQVEAVFRANVLSAYFCAREAVRRMSTTRGGRGGAIVNMSSVASRLGGLSGGTAYAGSKGAIDSFTLALAKEVGSEGIRVNALRPGLIETEMHGDLSGMREMARHAVPLGRTGTAREVAEVALWAVSDGASYVHGTCIDIAGGR